MMPANEQKKSPVKAAVRKAKRLRRDVTLPVFTTTAVLSIVLTVVASLAPTHVNNAFAAMVDWTGRHFGAFYIALATTILVLVIVIALSRFGRIRLGEPHSRPDFSLFSWAAMLFAAGISTDIMFFAVAEPIAQYMNPPTGPGQTAEAARQAVVLTMFHYGLHGWGLYTLMGLALAFFAFRKHQPLSLRSTLRPLFGDKVDGWLGHIVDAAAIIGGLFGIATSLGVGIVQLTVGLEVIFGIERGVTPQLILLALGVGTACISAISGVAKGIRLLSTANVILAGLLALFVLVTGRPQFLIDAMVSNIGELIATMPHIALETYAWDRPDDWLNSWTLFFWAWWIAWAAFVGLFLARISRGRTIREFVAGTLTIPFAYVVMWVGVFGNSALDLVRGDASLWKAATSSGIEFAEQVMATPEEGLFAMLGAGTIGPFVVFLAVIVGLLFYVTSADSGALVMANLSMKHESTTPDEDLEPEDEMDDEARDAPAWLRIFWALATGTLTVAMLLAGGIPILQSATVVMALPFAFILIAVAYCLIHELRILMPLHEVADSVNPPDDLDTVTDQT